MPCLVSDIITDVISELSQVPGTSTQVYASPRIQQLVQDASILMIEEMWWPDLMQWYQVTPDGLTGIITSDLVSTLSNHKVTRFQDIEAVYPIALNKPLRQLPPHFNPFTLSGSNALYVAPDATNALRPFRVWPATAADQLAVHARAYPILPIGSSDTVYLDRLLLTYFAAYTFSEDDGTNPGAIAKFQSLFEKRLVQVKAAWNQQPLQLDTRFPTTEYQWSERE